MKFWNSTELRKKFKVKKFLNSSNLKYFSNLMSGFFKLKNKANIQ